MVLVTFSEERESIQYLQRFDVASKVLELSGQGTCLGSSHPRSVSASKKPAQHPPTSSQTPAWRQYKPHEGVAIALKPDNIA